jgi:hypothetical protein
LCATARRIKVPIDNATSIPGTIQYISKNEPCSDLDELMQLVMKEVVRGERRQVRWLFLITVFIGLLGSHGSLYTATPRFSAQRVEMPVAARTRSALATYKAIQRQETPPLIHFRSPFEVAILNALSQLLERKAGMSPKINSCLPLSFRLFHLKIIPSSPDFSEPV